MCTKLSENAKNVKKSQTVLSKTQSKNHPNYIPKTTQLGFFSELKPDLIIKPVDRKLALADDRFYICYGAWFAGIQLTRDEAYRLLERLSGFDWTLDARGVPVKSEAIYGAIKRFLMGGES